MLRQTPKGVVGSSADLASPRSDGWCPSPVARARTWDGARPCPVRRGPFGPPGSGRVVADCKEFVRPPAGELNPTPAPPGPSSRPRPQVPLVQEGRGAPCRHRGQRTSTFPVTSEWRGMGSSGARRECPFPHDRSESRDSCPSLGSRVLRGEGGWFLEGGPPRRPLSPGAGSAGERTLPSSHNRHPRSVTWG